MNRLEKFLIENNALERFKSDFDLEFSKAYSSIEDCFEKSEEDSIFKSFLWDISGYWDRLDSKWREYFDKKDVNEYESRTTEPSSILRTRNDYLTQRDLIEQQEVAKYNERHTLALLKVFRKEIELLNAKLTLLKIKEDNRK